MSHVRHKAVANLKLIALIFFILLAVPGCFESSQVPDSPRNPLPRDRTLKAPLTEDLKTHILVLATPHLRSLGEAFKAAMVDSLLLVLANFKPDLICVESMPGSLIEDMERKSESYSEVLDHFAKDRIAVGHQIQNMLEVSRRKAEKQVDSLLQVAGTQVNSDTGRSDLTLWMLASYDLSSALLQWSYLPESERMNNEIVPDDIAAFLNDQLKQPNEINSIGISLAGKLGLQRVEGIDDHQDKDLFTAFAPELMNELKDNPLYKSVASSSLYADSERRLQEAVQQGNLLPYYLYLNSSEYLAMDVKTQWHLFFRTNLASGLDRARVALWEVRNLNIASHIRRATALHAGKRVLVLIGASHKWFLDAYLSQMMDVRLVHLKEVAESSVVLQP